MGVVGVGGEALDDAGLGGEGIAQGLAVFVLEACSDGEAGGYCPLPDGGPTLPLSLGCVSCVQFDCCTSYPA